MGRSRRSRSGFSRSGRSRSRRGGAPIIIKKDSGGDTCLVVTLVVFGLLLLGAGASFGLIHFGIVSFGEDTKIKAERERIENGMKVATEKMDGTTRQMQEAMTKNEQLAVNMKKSAEDVNNAAKKIGEASQCSPWITFAVSALVLLGGISVYVLFAFANTQGQGLDQESDQSHVQDIGQEATSDGDPDAEIAAGEPEGDLSEDDTLPEAPEGEDDTLEGPEGEDELSGATGEGLVSPIQESPGK